MAVFVPAPPPTPSLTIPPSLFSSPCLPSHYPAFILTISIFSLSLMPVTPCYPWRPQLPSYLSLSYPLPLFNFICLYRSPIFRYLPLPSLYLAYPLPLIHGASQYSWNHENEQKQSEPKILRPKQITEGTKLAFSVTTFALPPLRYPLHLPHHPPPLPSTPLHPLRCPEPATSL